MQTCPCRSPEARQVRAAAIRRALHAAGVGAEELAGLSYEQLVQRWWRHRQATERQRMWIR